MGLIDIIKPLSTVLSSYVIKSQLQQDKNSRERRALVHHHLYYKTSYELPGYYIEQSLSVRPLIKRKLDKLLPTLISCELMTDNAMRIS